MQSTDPESTDTHSLLLEEMQDKLGLTLDRDNLVSEPYRWKGELLLITDVTEGTVTYHDPKQGHHRKRQIRSFYEEHKQSGAVFELLDTDGTPQ